MTSPGTPETVLRLSFGHALARALHVVAELGVADHLDDDRPRDAAALAAELGADADALQRLLRLLETEGLFRREADGTWCHTPSSRFLRSDHPASARAFARMAGTAFGWDSFTGLGHAARTGEAGICLLDPAGWTSYLHGHPDEAAVFQDAMTAKAHADVEALRAHDFSPYSRVVDVGGGHGHLVRGVLARHDAVEGVLFDLPEVAARVAPQPRLEVVAGDFFRDALPAGDAYLLMNVLHDWDDEAAVRILEAVAAAGRPAGATVLLIEVLLPDGPAPHWGKVLDVVMLAVTGGRERTLREYEALLARAGMELVGVAPTSASFSLVEARVR